VRASGRQIRRVLRHQSRTLDRETAARADRRTHRERHRRPVRAGRKVFREWISIATLDRSLWQTLLAEAVDFARKGLAE
jgi:hypothetical protein